ncbi:MAG: DUF6079 family protein, partial [Halanaerobiales bacterium]
VLDEDHVWIVQLKKVRNNIFASLMDKKKWGDNSYKNEVMAELNNLKKEYIDIYAEYHSKARLGINEDRRKSNIMNDYRLNNLEKLSDIDIMPKQQLIDFKNKLVSLRSCFSISKKELDVSAICNDCGYKPNLENTDISATIVLNHLEGELDNIVTAWTQTLLNNLEDSSTKKNMELLKSDESELINDFLEQRELPENISSEFIHALKEVLSGLKKIVIKNKDLRYALISEGSPVTTEEMKKRFVNYLEKVIKGEDANKVRIILE